MIRSLFSLLKNKVLIVGVLILIQLLFLLAVILLLSEYFIAIYFMLMVLSFVVSVYILNRNDNPSYKMTWMILIMALPVLGGMIYLLFGGQKVPKKLRVRDHEALAEFKEFVYQDEGLLKQLKIEDDGAWKQANYLWRNAGFPLYQNTRVTYFPIGEAKFEKLCDVLRKAEHYIFLEYFIIAPGKMWDTILEILKEKVKAGVDVRIIYDDAGCFTTLPSRYHEILAQYGIKAKAFNPIEPKLAIQMNNRDHRKILVVDGKIAMTGGINLADEYINEIERFGHWKDNAVMLEGEAVWSLTLMFLQFWGYDEEVEEDILQFKPAQADTCHDGYVQPFCDAPTDEEHVGEYTHINMINAASSYVYIMTPYLILDHEMQTALIIAAKNGVDVRILVPHIPDKKSVFLVTQSNYRPLVEAGVRIYEYTPGFVHGKVFLCDDETAVVGTLNMDYRSYYLHYECGVWMYRSQALHDIKTDYVETLKQSQEITLEQIDSYSIWKRIAMAFLKLFSPLI